MKEIRKLTILYDQSCGFCNRCMWWLRRQPTYITLEFIPLQAEQALTRFPDLKQEIRDTKFIVVDNHGAVYLDSRGKIMCLYACKAQRALAIRLSNPILYPLVDSMFELVARNRITLSRALRLTTEIERGDKVLEQRLQSASRYCARPN